MQYYSGYGGVSEIPQLMFDGYGTSLFAISSSDNGASAASMPQQPPPQRTAAPLPPPHFPHLQYYSMPVEQQLLQQPHHQFQLFHHHQAQPPQPEHQSPIPHLPVTLDQDSGPENSASPRLLIMGAGSGTAAGAKDGGSGGVPSFLAAAFTFKLGVNETSDGRRQEVIDDDSGMLQGDDDGLNSRLHLWQREDDSAIKEPPWRPLDIDYINRNTKRCNEKEPVASVSKYCKKSKEVADSDDSNATGGSQYKLFSELEAIYKASGNGGKLTGSGSVLTADQTPVMSYITTDAPPGLPAEDHQVSESTETSAGEEATAKKFSRSCGARRGRKRRLQQQLSSVAAFFESLVKRVMDHQESLHRKFLEVMEKGDQERTSRVEAWRKQEAAKSSGEAAARARERTLAQSREAAIVSVLEKITGKNLNLPPDAQFRSDRAHKKNGAEKNADLQKEPISSDHHDFDSASVDDSGNRLAFNASRWPKAEVEALIQVRSGLESRFQEPVLKRPLWEEVSAMMSAMGYSRCAKRCKEKWENINKYFRKTKDKGKMRPHQSKTCPYFQQLDQLYSRTPTKRRPSRPPPSPSTNAVAATANVVGNSDMLDAVVVPTTSEANGCSTHAGNMEPLEHDQMDGDVVHGGDEEEPGGEEEEEEEDTTLFLPAVSANTEAVA